MIIEIIKQVAEEDTKNRYYSKISRIDRSFDKLFEIRESIKLLF